jgi:ribosomal protein S18 acetylase RimI-like enzyme
VTTGDATVRRAVVGDLDGLWPLVQQFYDVDQHDFDPARLERALKPLLVDDAFGQVWVLVTAGDLVGYAVVTWSWSLESGGRDSILDEIYVETRSVGFGSRLLGAALAGAREAGARAVFLETEAHNERVRSFYQRHGFAVDDSVWMSRSLLA